MTRISAKQRANIERYKKRGWAKQDIEKCPGLRFGPHNRTNFMDSMVLPLDFDPPAPVRITRAELRYIVDM